MSVSPAVSIGSSDSIKTRKLHPIVQVAQTAATELNDLLNAIGLRVALMRRQLEPSAADGEMARLAALIEKASERVQRLQDYARAEQLVASMRPGRARRRSASLSGSNTAPPCEPAPQSALLISGAAAANCAVKEALERSGCTVVVAESADAALTLLQSGDDFDQILCDSAILADTGWKFSAELSRIAPTSRVYVLHPHRTAERTPDHRE
jgi:PleD family two-component response regulator